MDNTFRQRLGAVFYHLQQMIKPLENMGCLQVRCGGADGGGPAIERFLADGPAWPWSRAPQCPLGCAKSRAVVLLGAWRHIA